MSNYRFFAFPTQYVRTAVALSPEMVDTSGTRMGANL